MVNLGDNVEEDLAPSRRGSLRWSMLVCVLTKKNLFDFVGYGQGGVSTNVEPQRGRVSACSHAEMVFKNTDWIS